VLRVLFSRVADNYFENLVQLPVDRLARVTYNTTMSTPNRGIRSKRTRRKGRIEEEWHELDGKID